MEIYSWICLLLAVMKSDKCVNSYKILTEIECGPYKECRSFNYIPDVIPDNVTMIILHDVQNVENIKKGTFDGKNWTKVKYLKISKIKKDQELQSSYSKSETYSQIEMNITNGKQRITTIAPLQSNIRYTGLHKNEQLKYIKSIEPYAMEMLKSLEELYIESDSFEGLDYGSFAGLDRLEVLCFKKCERLLLENIIKAINGSEMVSNLQTLSMTYINVVPWNGVVLGKDFFTALSTKPLQLLDIHKILLKNIEIKYASGTVVNTLKYFNLSGVSLNQIDYGEFKTFKQPKLLDLSSVTLPMSAFLFMRFIPLSNSVYHLSLRNTNILINFESLDFSDIYHQVKPIEVKNLTVKVLNAKDQKWLTKNIMLRQNRLRYLDLTIEPCINSSYEMIDLSYNGMTFLQPNLCCCCFNLKKLNLSYNELHEMSENNYSLFSRIFNFYPSLKEIYLISNGLSHIPEEIFKENNKLETIDLSHNKLEQVRFRLLQLKYLKLLNLQYNKFVMLDPSSLHNLKSIKPNVSMILDFRYNPISCSKCDTLQSIQWLATSPFIIRSTQSFFCINDEGTVVPIDRSSEVFVQTLCDRLKHTRNIIVTGTLVPAVSIILVIATTCIIKKYRHHKQYAINTAEKLRLIKEDAMDTKFVVFLCFSSKDDDFVRDYVYQPLNQCLKDTAGTDRDLVACGDEQFHPGKEINDEAVRCLEQSSVIIVILSRNFCSSEYCRTEFGHAVRMDKPIILMLKEKVDEEEMVPSLRYIFRKNVRILWENLGNDYHLKTSWENVCTSILELVQY